MNKKARWYTPFIHKVLLAAAVAAVLGGCGKKNDAGQETEAPEPSSISIELETEKNPEPVKILTIGEEPMPVLPDLPVLDENPRSGVSPKRRGASHYSKPSAAADGSWIYGQ